jgi:tetratricopeptide (TPR) repeat protein
MPEHVMARWDDGKFKRNIETTDEGKEDPDTYCELEYGLPQKSIEKGVYLRNLSKKEAIGLLLNNRGAAYYSEGDIGRAISDYSKALRLNPNFAEVYYNLGNIYENRGDFVSAISDFNKALRLNPNDFRAYYERADAYAHKGDFSRALLDILKALELDPNLAEDSEIETKQKPFWKKLLGVAQ